MPKKPRDLSPGSSGRSTAWCGPRAGSVCGPRPGPAMSRDWLRARGAGKGEAPRHALALPIPARRPTAARSLWPAGAARLLIGRQPPGVSRPGIPPQPAIAPGRRRARRPEAAVVCSFGSGQSFPSAGDERGGGGAHAGDDPGRPGQPGVVGDGRRRGPGRPYRLAAHPGGQDFRPGAPVSGRCRLARSGYGS